MNTLHVILTIIAATLFTSCKIHFTETTRLRLEKSKDLSIEKIQFYNDMAIQMVYRSTTKNDAVKSGKVKFKDGFYHYQIDIPKNTKAVAKKWDKNELQIHFEDGNDTYLTFKNNRHQNWELYQLEVNQSDNEKFVSYDGKNMQLTKGSNSLLKIKKSLKKEKKKDKKRVKGLRVL